MADRFEDHRGHIQDLLGPVDAVTEIFTKAGAIRGNHYHAATTQWAYVTSGRMLFARAQDDGLHEEEHGPGDLVCEPPGVPHAWRAITDCTVLVLTRGPRAGDDYETDVIRLDGNGKLLA